MAIVPPPGGSTWARDRRLVCDGCGVEGGARPIWGDVSAPLRREARRAGWLCSPKRDLCPACWAKTKEAKTRG